MYAKLFNRLAIAHAAVLIALAVEFGSAEELPTVSGPEHLATIVSTMPGTPLHP